MRENYGFEKVDMHEIPGVIRCFVNLDLQMVIAEADELISRRCSNSIPDNMQEQMHIFTTFQNKIACHFLLIVWKEQEEDRQLFFSDTKRTRAIEFMDYMISVWVGQRWSGDCIRKDIVNNTESTDVRNGY